MHPKQTKAHSSLRVIDEFKDWVEGYGIEHRQAGGDPAALMKLSVEHTMFSPGFFKESLGHFRSWLDDLLKDSWESCHDADVLIESPSTMSGIHVAEGLGIPYFVRFTLLTIPITINVKMIIACLYYAVDSNSVSDTSAIVASVN